MKYFWIIIVFLPSVAIPKEVSLCDRIKRFAEISRPQEIQPTFTLEMCDEYCQAKRNVVRLERNMALENEWMSLRMYLDTYCEGK